LIGRILRNVKANNNKRFLLTQQNSAFFKKSIKNVKFFSNNFNKIKYLKLYAKLGRILSYAYKKRGKAPQKISSKRTPLNQLFRKSSSKKPPVLNFFYKIGGKYKRRNRTFHKICKK